MKCVQLSSDRVFSRSANIGRQRGAAGFLSGCMFTSCDNLFALRVLQRMQEVTMFSQVVRPPRDRGTT